jgi:hypothetical protein
VKRINCLPLRYSLNISIPQTAGAASKRKGE